MKKILFIGLNYREYTNEIIHSIESIIGNVDYYDIELAKTFKILKIVCPKLYQIFLNRYHKRIINRVANNKYDCVFFLQSHQVSKENFDQIKKDHLDSTFISYNWDSVETHNYIPYIKYFDRVFSFDPEDCKKNDKIEYLPLFYVSSFKQENIVNTPSELVIYDLAFVGNIFNERRYEYIKKMRVFAKQNELMIYDYCTVYLKTYIVYFLKNFKLMHGVHLKTISCQEIADIYKKTNVILDLPNNIQSGLTMRVFEIMAMRKKLLTTNKTILTESFYHKNNICVFDLDDIIIPSSFFSINYSENKALESYSLDNWVCKLFKSE